jgi:hypothetical protein
MVSPLALKPIRRAIVACLFTACSYSLPDAARDQLVSNPSFEEGDFGWALPPGYAVEKTAAHHGDHALQLGLSSASDSANQTLPIMGGEAYLFTAWIKPAQAAGESGLSLEFLDEDGAEIARRKITPPPSTDGDFALERAELTAPADARVVVLASAARPRMASSPSIPSRSLARARRGASPRPAGSW